MNVSFFRELIGEIVERGRHLTHMSLPGSERAGRIMELARMLMSRHGESSGVALAQRILNIYEDLDEKRRHAFFAMLAEEFVPDRDAVHAAAERFLADPSPEALDALARATESPRQEFFRRLNLAPGGTAAMVAMRTDLMRFMAENPELKPVDDDLTHLFGSWFNRGFLVLKRIDWSSPANILEKIIQYEAVHQIKGWDDLKRRLDPRDRRCFAFFHPSLVDEPLIFVEVALTYEIPGSIHALLNPPEQEAGGEPTTAVFYSISNCQKGLARISFGNFLIKQVVTDLTREMPSLRTFVTLSPAPGFQRWLDRERRAEESAVVSPEEATMLKALDRPDWNRDEETVRALKPLVTELAAHYFLREKRANGQPVDPVARFHLGNGARLERINWLGDTSERGLAEAAGLMVNYLYELKDIEKNHEAYAEQGRVVASTSIHRLARADRSKRTLVAADT